MISKKEVNEIFETLNEQKPRYYIQTGNLGNAIGVMQLNFKKYSNSTTFKNDISEKLDKIIFNLKRSKSLNKITNDYLILLRKDLKTTLESFKTVEVKSNKIFFQPNSLIHPVNYVPNEKGKQLVEYTIETIPESFLNELINYSQIRYSLLSNFVDALDNLITPIGSETNTKLFLNLSVPEIALLFKLLDDAGLIKYDHKTDLFRFISNSIRSTGNDNISEFSIKNNFHSPELRAKNNIRRLLLILQGKLNN